MTPPDPPDDGQDEARAGLEPSLTFGLFKLLPRRRCLLRAGRVVPLGSRAIDILILLTDRAGEVVAKAELISRVWPSTFVGAANLRVHIGALRKALGEGEGDSGHIRNVTGRGYSFVAEVTRGFEAPDAELAAFSTDGHRGDGHPPIGRDAVIASLAESLERHRLVSIVGSAGIGKTIVARAVAARFAGAARMLDFAEIAAVPTSAALMGSSGNLLILDHCDLVLDSAAALAEELLKSREDLHILAVGREALRAEGERVHHLAPLDMPSAVALFVERASAVDDGFEAAGKDVALIADICGRLEGNPLAIEAAAAQTEIVGLRDLVVLIDDGLLLTARGTRAGTTRHRTLAAALDWSYDALGETEQAMLRGLASFTDCFSLEEAVVAIPDFDDDRIFATLMNLVGKSLVIADADTPRARYRLDHMTRAYILGKAR